MTHSLSRPAHHSTLSAYDSSAPNTLAAPLPPRVAHPCKVPVPHHYAPQEDGAQTRHPTLQRTTGRGGADLLPHTTTHHRRIWRRPAAPKAAVGSGQYEQAPQIRPAARQHEAEGAGAGSTAGGCPAGPDLGAAQTSIVDLRSHETAACSEGRQWWSEIL